MELHANRGSVKGRVATTSGGVVKVMSFDGGAFIYPTKTAQDRRLSLAALGLLTMIASRPGDWRTYVDQIADECDVSPPTARKLLNELIAFGYCKRWQTRLECGRQGPVNYLVCLDPEKLDATPAVNHCDRAQQNRVAVKPHSGEIATTYQRPPQIKKSTKPPLPPRVSPQALKELQVAATRNIGRWKRTDATAIDPTLVEKCRGLGVPVEMIEADCIRPGVRSPGGLFRTKALQWLGEQLPNLRPELARSALNGSAHDYAAMVNLMTMRQAWR